MPKAAKSIVIGVALGAITGGAGFLVGAAVGTVAFTAAAAATTIATSAVLGGLSAGLNSALAAKPLKPSSSTSIRQPAFALGIPYGETRVSGGWTVYELSEVDSRDLILAVTHSCCSIEGHLEVWAGDKLLWTAAGGDEDAASAEVETFNGGDEQTTPALLATHLPGVFTAGAAWQRGCAGYVIRFVRVGKKWPNLGAPWARVEGCNTVFDPRTGLRRYSRSWALCVADYLTRQRGGAGYDYDQDIDDTALKAAANLCGESVSEDGGARPRYVLDGFVESDRTHGDVLDAMKVYAAGEIIDRNGLFVIQPGAYAAPTETLETADLAGPVSIDSAIAVERRIHGAEGVYSRADANFVTDSYPPVIFDGSPEPPDLLRIDLPMCVTPDRAQRLAGLSARQAQRALRVSADWGPAAFGLRAGDTRTLSLPMFGIAAVVEARSTALDLSPAGAAMRAVLLETGASFYAGVTATSAPVSTQSTLQNPNFVQPPTSVTVKALREVLEDGTVRRWLRVEWAESPDPYLDGYEVEWTQDGESRAMRTSALFFEIADLRVARAVKATVAAVNTIGARSVAVAAVPVEFDGTPTGDPNGEIEAVGDTTAPAIPQAITGRGIVGGFWLAVTPPTDLDLAGLRIYLGAEGASFAASLPVLDVGAFASGKPSKLTYTDIPDQEVATTRTFYATAFDRSGNEGPARGPLTLTSLIVTSIDADARAAAAAAQADADEAIADATQAIADSGTALALAQSVDTNFDSRVSDRIVADPGLAARFTEIEASANFLKKGDFEDGLFAPWEIVNANSLSVGNTASAVAWGGAGKSLSVTGEQLEYVREGAPRGASQVGKTFLFQGYASAFGSPLGAVVGIALYDDAGVWVGWELAEAVPAGAGAQAFSVELEITTPHRRWQAVLMPGIGVGTGTVYFANLSLTFADRDARARISTVEVTKVDAAGAVAAVETEISASAGGSWASLESLGAVTADIEGKVTSSYVLRATAGNETASAELVAFDDVTGGGSVFKVNADRLVFNGSILTDLIAEEAVTINRFQNVDTAQILDTTAEKFVGYVYVDKAISGYEFFVTFACDVLFRNNTGADSSTQIITFKLWNKNPFGGTDTQRDSRLVKPIVWAGNTTRVPLSLSWSGTGLIGSGETEFWVTANTNTTALGNAEIFNRTLYVTQGVR